MLLNTSTEKEKTEFKVLDDSQLSDSQDYSSIEKLMELSAVIGEVPICMLSLVDEHQLLISSAAHVIRQAKMDPALLQGVDTQESIFEVENTLGDKRFNSIVFVQENLHIRYYAGLKLISENGRLVGILWLVDFRINRLTENKRKALGLLANQLTEMIEIRRTKQDDKSEVLEDAYKTFFENAQGLMCTHDLDGNFLTINRAGALLLGYTTDEILRLNLADLVPYKYHPLLKTYLLEMPLLGKSGGLVSTRHKQAPSKTWSYNNTFVKNENGTDYVVCNCIDVTESRQLSARLDQAKEMLLQTNQVAKVGGWEINVKNRKVYWSEVTKQIHEVEPDFVPDVPSALGFLSEESRLDLVNGFNKASLDGTGFDLELELKTAKGKEIWIHVIGNAEFVHGKCKRVFGTLQDIDEKKRAETELFTERARLRAFVTHVPAAVAMLDTDLKYMAVSQKWIEEYNLTDKNIVGFSACDFFPTAEEKWKGIFDRCLQGAVIVSDEEKWSLGGWGQDQYIKWEVKPWYQFDGVVGGVMLLTQNVTEATLSREELKQAKLQSDQASMVKSEFLANMSHEIRTPLNGVIGFTDLMLKTKMDDTQKEYLDIVNQSANALLNIINDILDFSKIESGKLELVIDQCDIHELATKSAEILAFPAHKKGLEMLLNIPAGLPRFAWVDEIRLKQVLVNLLSNAAKFTESGEIELKIEVLENMQVNGDEMTCRFSVRDTGIGIREEKQAKIFEAFLQEDGSTTKKYGGAGLGLTISNKLLGMMGSRLQMQSIQGKGSTFFFDLKMRVEEGEPAVWANPDSIKKVLIVDDNAVNRTILEKMLQLLKIDSDAAKSGSEALEIISSGIQYDAILMDYHMPDMNGMQTIYEIRKTFPEISEDTRIILLSSSSEDMALAGDELKVDYQLIKPIKLDDIRLCLSRITQKENVETASPSGETKEVNSERLLILVSEDNPVNMFLAKTVISKIAPNSEIVEAVNGVQAVEFCKKRIPDIIFMDIQMPEMNGHEATVAIRNLLSNHHVPIIALTAGNTEGEKEKCLNAGMDDFITKPYVQESIRQVLYRFTNLSGVKLSENNESVSRGFMNSHIDIAKLKSAYMNDQEFITEFLQLTSESLKKGMQDLMKYYGAMDLAGIKATGHRLKGAAASAYLSEVTNTSRKLEQLTVFDHVHVEKLLAELQAELDLLFPLLEAVDL